MPRTYPLPEPDRLEATSQEVVLGVDTHKDRHVAAVLTAVGVVLGTAGFPTTAAGYQQLLAWACEYGTPRPLLETLRRPRELPRPADATHRPSSLTNIRASAPLHHLPAELLRVRRL